jgi:hypothetical protein
MLHMLEFQGREVERVQSCLEHRVSLEATMGHWISLPMVTYGPCIRPYRVSPLSNLYDLGHLDLHRHCLRHGQGLIERAEPADVLFTSQKRQVMTPMDAFNIQITPVAWRNTGEKVFRSPNFGRYCTTFVGFRWIS